MGMTTMGVIKLLAPRATTSRSKRINSSPARTIVPGRTRASNPRPPSCTVSIPMWISRSMPWAVRIETAWALAGKATISPAQGASRTGLVGSMATPSPSMRPANTGSGTSSSGPHQPSQGARICSIDISSLLPDLDPIERPEGIEPRTRETRAWTTRPREPGQALRGQHRHPCATGGRRKRQPRQCRRRAAFDANFQLPFRRARIADANLGRIGADLVIERQGGHGSGDARTRREVDAALDPARIHDIDGERLARSGRLEQQSDAVAAELELVSVAAQSGVSIEALVPRPRSPLGFDEGRGTNLRTLRHQQRRLITRRLGRGFAAVEAIADAAEGAAAALGLIGQSQRKPAGAARDLRGRREHTVGIIQAECPIAGELGHETLEEVRPAAACRGRPAYLGESGSARQRHPLKARLG